MTADSLMKTGFTVFRGSSINQTSSISCRQMDYPSRRCSSHEFHPNNFGSIRNFDHFSSTRHDSSSGSSCGSSSSYDRHNSSSGSSGHDESDHVIIVNNLNRACKKELMKEFGHLREPTSHVTNYSRLGVFPKNPVDFDLIYERLHLTGWFYPHMTMYEAKCKLRECRPGTFLLRNSSDPSRLFSLSVKTKRGTTSIRVQIQNGLFSLESDPTSASPTPSSSCVIELVQLYVKAREQQALRRRQEAAGAKPDKFVLLETTGRMDTPLTLERALTSQPHSLAHLSRLAFNKQSEQRIFNKLQFVPPKIEEYLRQYPYSV